MEGNIKAFHIGAAYKDVRSPSEGVAIDNERNSLKAQWGVRREPRIYIEFEHEYGHFVAYFDEAESLKLITAISKSRARARELMMTPEERARAEAAVRMIREAQDANEKEYAKAVEVECRIFDATKAACKLLEKDGHRAEAVALRSAIKAFFGEGIPS